MGYIEFDKTQLINLEYSLNKEMIRSNRAGSFTCTSILGCHTRKYNGLLICPQPQLDGGLHVLLSKVDETIIQHEAEFNIGVNKFPGSFFPKGHKYVRDFSADIIPVVTYRVGGVVLTKETMFVTGEERILIRYTLVEAHSPTRLRLRPFLAFRNIHHLSKKNIDLDTHYQPAPNGIRVRMYDGYSDLFMQLSRKTLEYVHVPDWYNDFEYIDEQERGYDCHEDLYTPGFFELPVRKGESVIFSASTREVAPAALARHFDAELKKRTPRNSFENCLVNSAQQFFNKQSGRTGLVAGYPWYGELARYSLMALPGLRLALPSGQACRDVIDTMVSEMDGPFFRDRNHGREQASREADTSLWFFWTVHQCFRGSPRARLWQRYGDAMKRILEAYIRGIPEGVGMKDNGLLYISPTAPPLTWMNAMVNGKAATPRHGHVVEVNALWYNALCYGAELARAGKDLETATRWTQLARKAGKAFTEVFAGGDKPFLADFVVEDHKDHSVRPNQILAASLPYSPIPEAMRRQVVEVIQRELLTPRGLRTLSPRDMRYRGRYRGNVEERDAAFHQGTAWPWLLGHFAEACLRLYGEQGRDAVRRIYEGFQETMKENAIGTVSEVYDGDPPHKAGGASSFAPSVAELLRIHDLLASGQPKFRKNKSKNT